MDVTVIIVNYNTINLTIKSIYSIKEYTHGLQYEIIVVDNASNDNSVSEIRHFFPDITIIENKENEGFGKANNKGISIANGEFVFLLNSDAFLTSNSLLIFYNFMKDEKNDRVAICGGELITDKGEKTASFGNFPSLTQAFLDIGFSRLLWEKYITKISLAVINYDNEIKEVDFLAGADMFIRKKYLIEYGFFDEDFFLYFEETELSYRFYLKGLKSVILPSEKIIHLVGYSQVVEKGKYNYKRYERFVSSRALFYKKCYGNTINVMAKVCYILQEVLKYIIRHKLKDGRVITKISLILKG